MSLPHAIEEEYDLIFAGGGTAACITASRLATAFPDLKILVLESGPTTEGNMEHIIAGHYLTHLAPGSKTMQFYTSKPSENLGGRAAVVPSGRCIGGGSSVNWQLYNRPSASDFDDWETEFGNVGWGSKEMIPMLQKCEKYEIDTGKPNHGSDGPLRVSYGQPTLELAKQFLEIGPKFEKDRPWADEGNGTDLASINVFFPTPKWTSTEGTRSDVPHHYIYNKQWKNLFVVDGCLVKRVVIEDGIATGVEYLFDKRIYENSPQDVRIVKARNLVIVAAGAMGSPLILERSGVGKRELLKKAGIPVKVDLAGVGENYQDHIFAISPYLVDPNTKTYDSLFRGEPETWGPARDQWERARAGVMADNGCDAAIKMRPRQEELAELGPDFVEYWNTTFANKPDKPLFWLSSLGGLPADQAALGIPPLKFVSSGCFLAYPLSRGSLHITSSDPYAAPDFDSGFLSNPADVVALRWGYKKGRELLRRLPVYRGAFLPVHPVFPEGSDAALSMKETASVAIDAKKVIYTKEDDEAIDKYLRGLVHTTWHSLGTCAMKPLEMGGVVDSKLNVYGVKNLKVADLSIPPSNVNSNTYSTATAIGERAAVIIAEELGLEL